MINVLEVPYKSIEVEIAEHEVQILSEGNKITFVTEGTGEAKEGIITGFKGSKPEKVEIEMIPINEAHKEIWKVTDMVEGSLKLVEETDNDDEE